MSSLEAPVLVLDRNYHPIKIATAREAVELLFTEKALVLDSSYVSYTLDDWIEYSSIVEQSDLPVLHSSKINFIVPEVIVLPEYIRKPSHGRKLKYSRNSVFRRDGYQCQYCGNEFKRNDLTVDHILPKSRGGRSTWLNITTACKPCNWKKADRTPEEAGMRLLSVPKIPTWKESLETINTKKDSWNNFI